VKNHHRNNLNLAWSLRLLTLLQRSGVRDFCIAPGSRSAPLALAAEALAKQEPDVRLQVHFDERGLGFFALGLIRGSDRPVAVITTSGTAVANLLPATVEAFQSHKPLILVTADRPDELLNCGANQAIDQVGIFGTFAPTQVTFQATPDAQSIDDFDQQWSTIARQLARPLYNQGPIHINCPFRDPLYPSDTALSADQRGQCDLWLTSWPEPERPVSNALPAAIDTHEGKTLMVVLGQMSGSESSRVLEWAETHGYPVIADFGSGQRLARSANLVPYPELVIATPQGQSWLAQFDKVVQFGGRITGKRLGQWLAQGSQEYVIVTPTHQALDPSHRAHHMVSDVARYCSASHPMQKTAPLPRALITRISAAVARSVQSSFSELTAISTVCEWLPQNSQLFAGNSLAIRWLDSLAPQIQGQITYCQRGASGIDGLIATTLGIATATRQPLIALLGDTSALHDLNSLALAAQCDTPLIVLITNNSGGSIFNLLPIAALAEANRTLFQCEHHWQFANAAAMFELPYYQPTDATALTQALAQAYKKKGASIIECRFPPTEATDLYQQLIRDISE